MDFYIVAGLRDARDPSGDGVKALVVRELQLGGTARCHVVENCLVGALGGGSVAVGAIGVMVQAEFSCQMPERMARVVRPGQCQLPRE